MKWFNSMATTEEKATLLPARSDACEPTPPKPDEGARRRIAEKLHDLIVERLRAAYAEGSIHVPRDMQKVGYQLPCTGLASHLERLKSEKHAVVPEASSLAAWRTAREQQEADSRFQARTSGSVDRFVWLTTAVWRALRLRASIMDTCDGPRSLTFVKDDRYMDFLCSQTSKKGIFEVRQ